MKNDDALFSDLLCCYAHWSKYFFGFKNCKKMSVSFYHFQIKVKVKITILNLSKILILSQCVYCCLFFEKCSIYCRLHLRAIIRVLCQYFAAWIEVVVWSLQSRPGILLRSFWQMGILPCNKRQPIKMFGLLMANSVGGLLWHNYDLSKLLLNVWTFWVWRNSYQVLLNPSILATRGVLNAAATPHHTSQWTTWKRLTLIAWENVALQ